MHAYTHNPQEHEVTLVTTTHMSAKAVLEMGHTSYLEAQVFTSVCMQSNLRYSVQDANGTTETSAYQILDLVS